NDVAEEDAEIGVVFFKFGKGDKLSARPFSKYKFPAGARLLVENDRRKALMTWGVGGKTGKGYEFFMTELDPAKQVAEDPKKVELPVSSEVESWSAAPYGDGMMIAYVDGDSLVGQAKLRISRVY